MAQNDTKKKQKSSNNESSTDEIALPLDGGFGWVIVAASFLTHIITDGITYTFGVMYIALLKEFNEGKGYTSWIVSLMCGMTLCSGPISSSFVNKYGCRPVSIAGAFLSAACLSISYYANNVLTLIITVGFGVGCGLGMVYLPAIVSVSTYFERYRSIAIGIAVSGSGLGTFIFAPLVTHFVNELGWRKTMLVLAGIVLNCAVFGAFFRPLPKTKPKLLTEQHDLKNEEYEFKSVQNLSVIPEENHRTRSHSVGQTVTKVNSKGRPDDARRILSQPLLTNGAFDTVYENKTLCKSHKNTSGTLSRLDIFYQGSLCNIENRRSHNELPKDIENGFHHQDNEIAERNTENCCGCIPVNSQETFCEMLKFDLLADPLYLVFAISNFCICLGFYVPYFCLADKAKMIGLSSKESSYLLAIIGIANTVGRIVIGYVSDQSWVNRLRLYSICIFTCGCATASSVLCVDFQSLAVFAVIFGFTIGSYVGLTSVILVDLFGLAKLTNAFGLLLLFMGTAGFVGPPIVGLLYDISQSYAPGFLFAGAMIALSGFVLFYMPALEAYCNRKRNQRANMNKNSIVLKMDNDKAQTNEINIII